MTPAQPIPIFSNGAGKDSMALMILQAQGKTLPFIHVFANVGEKAENPATMAYIRDHMKPYAERHGIEFIETFKRDKDGNPVDLWDYTLNPDTKSIPIPYYLKTGAPARRTCTTDFKVRVVSKWIRAQGYKNITLGIGFNYDEGYRMLRKPLNAHDREMKYDSKKRTWKEGARLHYTQIYKFPLIELAVNRASVEQIITAEGLPIPPKSCCIFCPFMTRNERIEQKRDPLLWQSVLNFEQELRDKIEATRPKTKAYLHPDRHDIRHTPDQSTMWDLWQDTESAPCNEGYCGL